MARGAMPVRLWLPHTKVVGIVVDASERLVVRVRSTVLRPKYPHCSKPSRRVHDRRGSEVRDLKVSVRPVTLIWERRRMVCADCERRFSEEHPAFEGRVITRLAGRLIQDTGSMTVNAAARRHKVIGKLVNALVASWAGLVADEHTAGCFWSMKPQYGIIAGA